MCNFFLSSTVIMDVHKLREVLFKHGQDHLLKYWSRLNEEEQRQLYDDLISIDYEEMNRIFRQSMYPKATGEGKSVVDLMEPIDDQLCGSVDRASEKELARYNLTSMEAIARNEIGVLLLAGGQGTRLGVSYPKGMFDIGLPSHKTLYQIQVERILRLQELSSICTSKSGKIMMYVMTSEHTKKPTEEFFESHKFFGLDKDQIVFFEQRMIPCFTKEGQILLETKSKVARAPDGNGGLYWALKHEHVLDHMKNRGVKYLHVYCVDNVLVKVADPMFMGYCIDKGAESGNKVVRKKCPNEAVGVVCKVDGRFQVVEYSEIGFENSHMRDKNEQLVYNAGNICNHFFTTEFLDKVCYQKDHLLPYHVAHKKIPVFDDELDATHTPSTINGVKLEKFVFDVFGFSDNFVVWECRRIEEFSPLKNADSDDKDVEDTPTTARNALFALHKLYIERSGGSIVVPHEVVAAAAEGAEAVDNRANQNGNGAIVNGEHNELEQEVEQCICEISPLISYCGENLEKILRDGKTFVSPALFSE